MCVHTRVCVYHELIDKNEFQDVIIVIICFII